MALSAAFLDEPYILCKVASFPSKGAYILIAYRYSETWKSAQCMAKIPKTKNSNLHGFELHRPQGFSVTSNKSNHQSMYEQMDL